MVRLLAFLVGVAAFAQQNQYVLVPSSAGNTGRLIFRERAANGTNEVRLKAPDNIAANVDFTMPAADGAANFSIATDGAGILSFKEMVSAFSHPGVQTILSDKYFATGLRTLDFELRDSVAGPISMQGYVTGWGSGALELIASSTASTISLMAESGGVGGSGVIEMYHPSSGLATLTMDSQGWVEMSHIATPLAAGGGRNRLYFKSTGELCSINNSAVEVCYGAGVGTPSLEMPVNFTVSGVTRAQMVNTFGGLNNVGITLNNSSNLPGASLGNLSTGGIVHLRDISGDGDAQMYTDGTNGATVELFAKNSSRIGLLLEGGDFTGGGIVRGYDGLNQLISTLDPNGLKIQDSATTTSRVFASVNGWIDLFQQTAPASPGFQQGRVYYSNTGNLCVKTQIGVNSCTTATGTYVTTDATVQNITGQKKFDGGLTFVTYGEMYAGTGSVPTIDFKSPTGGASTVLINGANTSVQASMGLFRNNGVLGWDVSVHPTTGATLMRFGTGTSEITTSSPDITIKQTGDSIGQSYIKVQNRAGAGGAILHADGVNVVDWKLESTSARQIRMEGRPGSLVCGYGDAELLFGDPGVALSFGISTNGACVTGSRPMRFMGSSTGYAALRAPASVSPYTWTLPTADSAGCVNSNGFGTLSIIPCGSNELPIIWTASGVERARLFHNTGNTVLTLRNSTNNVGISLQNYTSGSQIFMQDLSSLTGLGLYAGGYNGATIELNQESTSRIGARLQGGPFAGDTGSLETFDSLNNLRAILKDRLTIYISGVGTPSVDLGLNGAAGGRLIMRDGFGFTRAVVDQSGYSYFGSTPQSFTVNISCGAGTGTLTISGSIITGKTGAC